MLRALIFGMTAAVPLGVAAQDTETPALAQWDAARNTVLQAADVNLDDFVWQARPVVIFAETPNDPRYIEQLSLLIEGIDDVIERDVAIIVDTDGENRSALRDQLRPRGFMMVLIGKDGGVKLRKPFPWDVRELSRVIDKMPMRQREIVERRAANPATE